MTARALRIVERAPPHALTRLPAARHEPAEPDTPAFNRRPNYSVRRTVAVRIAFVLLGLLLGYLLGRAGRTAPAAAPPALADYPVVAAAPTLVIYSFAMTDAMSLGNLKHFLGVRRVEGCG